MPASKDQGKLIDPKDPDYVKCKGLARNPVTGHMEEMSFWMHKDHPGLQYYRENITHMSVSGLEDV